jgi:hypothetical protein
MSRPYVPVLVLAAFLTGFALLLWLWPSDQLPRWLSTAAASAAYVVASVTYLATRRSRAGRPLRVPDASPSSVLLGIGVALAVLGTALGRWLLWLGAGTIAVALIGLAAELSGARTGEPERQVWSEPPRGRPPAA